MFNMRRIVKSISLILIIILIVVSIIMLNKNLFDKEKEVGQKAEIAGYSITFDLNGADKIDRKTLYCTVIDNQCLITLPDAERNDGKVLGFSTNANDKVPEYLIGSTISIDKDMRLYVISEKKNKVYIENNKVDYLEKKEIECNAYNKDNKCKVIMPIFNKKGYENRGYSTSTNSLVGFVFPNEEYVISKDVTLYPIYGINNHLKKLEIAETYDYLNSTIEIEKGCTSDVYNNYLNYLEEIREYAPFLLLGNKISFVSDETFDTVWGSNYVGMNYGPRNLRAVDIRCGTKLLNDYYGTMVHEMSHSWDFYYATKIGKNITSESDMINLYNKYQKLDKHPFRSYSYSSIYEFLADMMKYYYFKYLVPKEPYVNFEFPNDMKKVIEKYICISKNNYDRTKCS